MTSNAILIATGKTVTSEDREPFYTLLAVEFGAGIVYNSAENPKAPELGFGVGTYPGQIHAFEDGWYYLDDKTETWRYTHGIKATIPMYNAEQQIIPQYVPIAREAFGATRAKQLADCSRRYLMFPFEIVHGEPGKRN